MWYHTNNKTSSMLFQGSHTISPWLITLYLHSHHHWVKVLHDVHDMQAHFAWARINKASISECTVCCWPSKLGWQYGKHKGMYVDSHEQSDVVEYRQAFVEWFKIYKCQFHTWDISGNELPHPSPGHSHLVLITHDKSTFYQNDQWQIHWGVWAVRCQKQREKASL